MICAARISGLRRVMYRRDYILRLIERLGRVLLSLRDRILGREADTPEVMSQIEEIAQQAGVDLPLARRLDPASLVMWLAPGDDFDHGRVWLVAELLSLSGLQAGTAGAGDLTRARALFARLPGDYRPSADLPSAGERATELKDHLV